MGIHTFSSDIITTNNSKIFIDGSLSRWTAGIFFIVYHSDIDVPGGLFISLGLTMDRTKQHTVAVNDSVPSNQLCCTYAYQ